MTDPITLPMKPDSALTKEQVEVERASIERAKSNARNLIFANVALLTAMTATQGFIDAPYLFRTLLWIALGLVIVSTVFCGLSIGNAQAFENRLDFYATRQNRSVLNRSEWISLMSFSTAFVLLSAFIGVNLVEALRYDRTVIDIVASDYQFEPSEAVSLRAEGVAGEQYVWAVSAGTLLDDDEMTVTWIAPSASEDMPDFVEIEVCVRQNHLFTCATDRLIPDESSLQTEALLFETNKACPSKAEGPVSRIPVSLRTREVQQTTELPPLILVPDIECCSGKLIKINCRWDC